MHRSDGSGTTYNFAYYLAEVSADWKSKVGVSTALQWPAGIGAKGNEGVANNVAQTKGSIGYVEYAYAKQNKLTYTKMVNKDGKEILPTSEAFQAAAANADWKSQPGYGVILANQPGANSWPMTAATWILVYKQPQDAAATAEALKFFAWSFAKGGKMAEDLDYVPMPTRWSRTSRRLGRGDQGRGRQAPLHQLSRTEKSRKGARWAPFLLRIQHARRRLVPRPVDRLSRRSCEPTASGFRLEIEEHRRCRPPGGNW